MIGLTPQEKDLLYRTVAAESGGESALGQQGVVHTILNRARSSRYPGSVGEVIRQPGQFSALNHLTGYAGGKGATPRFFEPGYKVNPSVIQNVDAVLAGGVEDPTGGALNYYNPAAASPKWGPGMANPITIGAHRFGTAGGPANNRVDQAFQAVGEPSATTSATEARPMNGMGGGSGMGGNQGGFRGTLGLNRGLLMGLGADLLAHGLDTRNRFTGRNMMLGQLSDAQRREKRAEAERAQQQANVTANYLESQGADPALVEYARQGMGAQAMSQWNRMQKEPGAPDVETFYDDQGRAYKAQWDGQQWQQVGGAKASQPLVSITNTPDGPMIAGEPGKAVSKADEKLLTSADESAAAVTALNANLDAAEALLDVGYETGAGASIAGQARRGLSAVGVPGAADKASQFEQFDAISKELAAEGLKAFGGSDTERELLVSMQATISPDKLPETNRAIIARKRKAVEIAQSRPDFLREWIRNHGTIANPSTNALTVMGVRIPAGMTAGEAWREYQRSRWKAEAPEMPSETTGASTATQPAITREQALEELRRRGEMP